MPKISKVPGAPPAPVEGLQTLVAAAADQEKKKGKRTDYLSGYCMSERDLRGAVVTSSATPEQYHAKCHGASTNGAGHTILCSCPHHEGEARCHECGYQATERDVAEGLYDAGLRRCADRTACADRIADAALAALEAPLHREVQAAYDRAGIRNPIRAKLRERGEPGEPGEPKPRSARKPRGEPRDCGCGCGEQTRGGEFRMGHDQRLKGRLLRAARGGDLAALAELVRRGWVPPGTETSSV